MNRIIISALVCISISANSQVKYSGKVESGYLKFIYHTIKFKAGPDWQGYNLNSKQNGIDINLVNGISVKDKLYAGLGVGYLNFEGIHGYSVFTDLDYVPFKSRLSPLLNFKFGYNHIRNQYENGKSSLLTEFGTGLNYKLTPGYQVYLQSGILFTQQALFIPVCIGINF